jgi:energy-coupling factor transporter ATP-binding protein EcfA2
MATRETTAAKGNAHIEVRDLTMAYGSFVLMRDLNFSVRRGDVFIIMGASGCGKSTLLSHMIGLNEPAKGEIFYDGETAGAMTTYNALTLFRSSPQPLAEFIAKTAEVTSLEFLDGAGEPIHVVKTGDALRIRVEYKARIAVSDASFGVFFYGADGTLHCQFTTWLSGETADLAPGNGIVEFSCEELGLQPGTYLIDTTIEQHGITLDWQCRCSTIQVNAGRPVRGLFYHPHTWREVSASSLLSEENVTVDRRHPVS